MDASRERGAAAVEFALVVPLLVVFLFAIVEGGTRYAQQSQVNHWAFIAARDLAIDPGTSATTVVNEMKGDDTTSYVISTPDTCVASEKSTVVVTATKTSPTGLFGTYTITGKGVARCEK